MTYEELEEKIIGVLQTPDSALVTIRPILDDVKKDYETMLSMTEKVAKQDTRIRDLQDTNMKLFLAQTGKKIEEDKDDEDDLTGAEAIDAFVNKLNENDEKV